MLKLLMTMLLLSFGTTSYAETREELLAKAQGMTNDQVWTALTTVDANGNTGFGKCKMATGYPTCASCACPYYFKGWRVNKPGVLDTAGADGWPKNDYGGGQGASTGCMGAEGAPICWDGSDPATMCTSSLKANAKAILLNALENSQHKYSGYDDVCGVGSLPPAKKANVSIMDSSKLFFVKPTEPCAAGKVLCGTTSIGDKVGTYESFNPLPAQFCAAAYGVLKSSIASFQQQGKVTDKDSRFISCSQYSQKQLDSATLAQAGSVLASMNTKFSGCDLIPFCDYPPAKINVLTNPEIALFYVALGEKLNSLPASVRPKVALLTPAELSTARDAYKSLQDKAPNADGKTYSLADALAAITGKK